MKLILCSQRVDYISNYGETRDCLDEKWTELMNICGFTTIPIPNSKNNTKELLKLKEISGILLTGGNSICTYENGFPQKDENERVLIEYAVKNNIPLLGVCRGMQSILDYYGIKLIKKDGHVRTTHSIDFGYGLTEINSFHEYCSIDIPQDFNGIKIEDDTYEIIFHKNRKITGIMWHPERYFEFRSCDIKLIKKAFGEN